MDERPVVILGGGINGAAAARELVLNGVSVWLVDTADLAFGATAYSSRLIHGGLRYLEFAEFSLVKESLDERGRLLRLAPHLVKPLRLFIPVRNSWGGLTQAAGKFLGLPLQSKKTAHRGLRVVQVGLWLYDRYATERRPAAAVAAPAWTSQGVPRSESARSPVGCGPIRMHKSRYPERLVIDLSGRCPRSSPTDTGIDFRVLHVQPSSTAWRDG